MIKELGKNRYRFIVSVGSGSSRKKYTRTVTCKTKRELKEAYEAFEKEVKKGPASDITLEELVNNYIGYRKAIGLKKETQRGYRICRDRISDSLKRQKAKKVQLVDIEKEIAQMAQNEYSAKTIRNTIGLISAAYNHAVKTEQLTENPCKLATFPKATKSEPRILHRDEIVPFLNAIADAPIDDRVAYLLALFLGLRRSEILGLKESDVDIINGMVSVHNTRHRVDGADYDSSTKTEQSTRVLALPDILIVEIARLLETHRQLKYGHCSYLVQDGFGNIFSPGCLTQRLRRLQEKHNLPFVGLHKLRHTYASLLNESGVDMAQISRQLGHSNLTTTSNLYTHLMRTPTQSSRGIAQTINTLELPEKENEEN